MAEYKEAKGPEKRSYKKLQTVEMIHHYRSTDGMSGKTESHSFEKGQHAEMAAHIAQHFPEVAQHLAAAMPGDKEQMASEPASENVQA